MEPTKSLQLNPIGMFHCTKKNPVEAARQASADISTTPAWIELTSGQNFEQALEGLETFSHLWLIFQFDRNDSWKPKVLPPRGSDKKQGVFATRSPYRPNPIGMSCVELDHIDGRKIFVRHHDLLDGTPIIDIKPYLAESDSFPEASRGWIQSESFEIIFSFISDQQILLLEGLGVSELRAAIVNQLSDDPLNSRKKRVREQSDTEFIFSYRTWRVAFSMNFDLRKIMIQFISSGYSEAELSSLNDTYKDKAIHKQFTTHRP